MQTESSQLPYLCFMQKIIIAGIGGVGGYFGGLLARHYTAGGNVSIAFMVRGENEKAIRENGLQLETTKGNFTVHPQMVSSDAAVIGIADLLIVSAKSYDLETILQQARPCIGKETVILPLLNGVDSTERIREMYPGNETWYGCVYLVSRLAGPGLVRETGGIDSLFFGAPDGTKEKLLAAETLFKNAGIEATLSPDILQTTWEKFVFISCVATLTSWLDQRIGEILASEDSRKWIPVLLAEIKAVADAKQIPLPENSIEITIEKIKKIPPAATSSMHSDFSNGKNTELESLTGYVVREGKAFGVSVPAFERMYEDLAKRR